MFSVSHDSNDARACTIGATKLPFEKIGRFTAVLFGMIDYVTSGSTGALRQA
jgi:hypothetical protein